MLDALVSAIDTADPLAWVILGATVAIIGNALVALINGSSQRTLEKQRAENTLILEMIQADSPGVTATNLRFLLRTGLISDTQRKKELANFLCDKDLTLDDVPVLPSRVSIVVPRDLSAITSGEYVPVPLSAVMDVVVATRQIGPDRIATFLKEVLEAPPSVNPSSHVDRWDLSVRGGGSIFIFRTRDETEFREALNGVLGATRAILRREDVEGVNVLVRGTERFYDIEGLPGVGSRAWIGYDLR